jgi:choline-sulfatase
MSDTVISKRFALLIGLILTGLCADALAAASRPNILFLFADDQSFETVRAFGHTAGIYTPNLDRLAADGATFTHAYNMGSWQPAVCVPSRAMLVTGRSLWRAEAIYPATTQERVAGQLWPQLLERRGYHTYFTGKWHVNTEAAKTFNVTKHVRPGMPKDRPEAYNRPLANQPDPWSPSDSRFGGFWEGGKHWSEVTAEDAIEFLGDARQRSEPFFMYVAFNAPHDPRQVPAEYLDKYPVNGMRLPASFLPEYPHKDGIGCGRGLRDEQLAPFPRTEHAVKVHRREYYASITHLDAQIGRVLDALESNGQAENTWIFFTADNGLAVGHHGLMGKQNLYDHSLRVPFIVVGPGVKAGQAISAPIYMQDVMPTTLELAGVPKPSHVDFHSLLPLLRGESSPARREDIYAAYVDFQRAVIHEGWKLILYPKSKVARLYHLAEDPSELKDLANNREHQGTKQRLFGRLLALQKELGDTLDLKAAFPDF